MPLLLIVSLIWAFSFGLIKGRLTGLDPTGVAVVRLAFAFVVFLPIFRPKRIDPRPALRLAAIGAIQFGAMYALYLRAFSTLMAHEVALFTILTPVYLALLDAAIANRFQPRHALAATLSVAGAGVLLWNAAPGTNALGGFILVQLSNLCFAAGQVAYRRIRIHIPDSDEAPLFAYLYAGGLTAVALVSLFATPWSAFRPTGEQWLVLLYLGTIASGLCFFLWNRGATRVNAGTLAAFNNAKVPLGVACSLLIFGEHANLPRLLVSLALLVAAVVVAERRKNTNPM